MKTFHWLIEGEWEIFIVVFYRKLLSSSKSNRQSVTGLDIDLYFSVDINGSADSMEKHLVIISYFRYVYFIAYYYLAFFYSHNQLDHTRFSLRKIVRKCQTISAVIKVAVLFLLFFIVIICKVFFFDNIHF